MEQSRDHRDHPAARIVAVLALLGLSITVFVRILNYEMRRDEQMYVPPADLLPDMGLYTDLFYNHVPSSAWLFYGMHSLLPSSGILFTSRLVVFGFWLLLALSVYWLVQRLSGSRWLALFTVFAIAANELVLGVAGMTATNNLLPLPLAFWGTGLFILAVGKVDGAPAPTALAGFLLAFAATIKASAVCYIPAIAIAAFLLPRTLPFARRFGRVVLPLAAGGLVGALPVLVYLVSEPQRFLAHVVGFHTGPHIEFWKLANDPNVAMGLGSSVRFAYTVWLSSDGAIAIFVLAWFAVSLWSDRSRRSAGPSDFAITLLLVAQALIAVLFGFVSTPSFPQYFVLPFAVLPLLMTHLYRQIDDSRKHSSNAGLIAATAVLVLIATPRLLQHLPKLLSPGKWTVAQIHDAGQSISAAMAASDLEGKVATLLPVYVLEGGRPVYPELATGQFMYRIADNTPDALLQHYVTTSPKTVQALFEKDPPAAMLLGFEPHLEEPFLAFARDNGYVRAPGFEVEDRYGSGELYLRPSSSGNGS